MVIFLLLIIAIQASLLINIKIMIMGKIMPFKSVIGTNLSVEHAGFMLRFKK